MFWKYNSNLSSPQIEAVLYKEDVTLQELMDEEDIINECKVQNKKLIDFLVRPEIMEELVTLTTVEPSKDIDEHVRFKYPNIACELLTCDVPTLNERLAGDEALLSKLYSFIDNDSELALNPLLASFFSKTMGVLIAKRSEQVLEFLKAKDNFISLLLKHLGTSAIMDLTLKLMTQVEGEMRPNILNWLDSQNMMQSLVGLLDAKVDSERHFNVAQLLCDFIKTARDTLRNGNVPERVDPLLNTIESPETITLLLGYMLDGEKCESGIVAGIQILLTLLEVNKTSIPNYDSVNLYSNSNSYDEASDQEQRQAVVQNVTGAVLSRLKDFHGILVDPPKKPQVLTTIGILDPPLGNTRLQVCRLLASFFATGNEDFMKEIMSLGTINVLLDLFFKYNWNNFLHYQVEQCIASAFVAHVPAEREGENALYTHLIVNCRLIERVLEAWNANELQQAQSKGVRQGYMGSLINIANNIVKLYTSSALDDFVRENVSTETYEAWEVFREGALSETNKTQEILLGGVHPTNINEDGDDYRIPYSQATITQQGIYTEYQIQQMSPAIIDSYGYNNEDFAESDDPLDGLSRRSQMNFNLPDTDFQLSDAQRDEIFSQICEENVSTLFGEPPFQSSPDRTREAYSSDSDEEGEDNSPHDDPFMNVDPWASRIPGENATVEDPWSDEPTNAAVEAPSAKTETTNSDFFSTPSWADFSSAFFESSFPPNASDSDAAAAPAPTPALEQSNNEQKVAAPTAAAAAAAVAVAGEGEARQMESAAASPMDVAENLAQKVDALKKEIDILKKEGEGDQAVAVAVAVAVGPVVDPTPMLEEEAAAAVVTAPPPTEAPVQPSISSSGPDAAPEDVAKPPESPTSV